MAKVDDFANVGRLEEEQIKALKDTEDALTKWDKFHSDYRALQTRLQTLPDKVTHEVMVPFGPLAFMPGQLQHTNEIMVLLGDNWFVERSAKQACEIIERRLKSIDKQRADLKSQQSLLLSRHQFTEEFKAQKNTFEIKEEYDPEQEKLWRERHRENVRLHKQKIKQEEIQGNISQPIQNPVEKSDEDLWRRLDELELQEKANRELERLPDVDFTSSEFIEGMKAHSVERRDSTDSGKKVRWKDEEAVDSPTEDSDDSSDDEGSESTSEEHGAIRPNTIEVCHTPLSDITKDSSPVEDESTTNIKSPADIYKYFGPKVSPKSILKEPSADFSTQFEDTRPSDVKEKIIVPGSTTAFSGTIVEKSSPSNPGATDSIKGMDGGPPKRVSKFKAQRQQMQR